MKKTFAILMVAAMMFATGCGKDNKPAEQAQQNTNAAVEQAKEKVDEAKKEAENAANAAQSMLDEAKATMAKLKEGAADKNIAALGGVVPGVNLETVTELLGDPIDNDGTTYAYSNGIDVKVADNIVQEVSTAYDGINTPANVAIGTTEEDLKAAYGDSITASADANGDNVYKFVGTDKKRAIEFVIGNGTVKKITVTLNK